MHVLHEPVFSVFARFYSEDCAEGRQPTSPYKQAAGSIRTPLAATARSRAMLRDFVNHTKKEYTRGDVHENRTECLFFLLKPYLPAFRGIGKTTLPGYLGFFRFLRNFRQLTACEQAELILSAVLDPAIAGRARKGDFVRCLDHFALLQSPIN